VIRNLHLSNFKCFRSQKVEFGGLTLLAGLNSSGKSTIIQSLLLLRQSFLEGTLPDTGLTINGGLVELGTAKDILHEEADDYEIRIRLTEDALIDLPLTFRYEQNSNVLEKVPSRSVSSDVWKMNLFTDGFQYIHAERTGPRTAFEMSDYNVRHHRRIGARGEYATHFLSTYGDSPVEAEMLLHSSATSPTLKAQVEAWMSEISPGLRLNVKRFSEIDLITFQVAYSFGSQVASAEYRPTNVGFGITYALPVVLSLLSAKSGELVIIENPEAHLHPRGQVKMGELIARASASGIQVIIETHSDHVLNGIRIAVHNHIVKKPSHILIYFTHWEPAATSPTLTELTIDEQGRLSDWPEGFFDETERSLDKLLANS
jgi:predicted ATPase